MKNFIAAGLISLAASNPLMAQDRIQDRFHANVVIACEDDTAAFHNFIIENTEMLPLFTTVGVITIPQQDGSELSNPSLMILYTDQESGRFAITATFAKGVSCLLTEGGGFEPYIE